VASPTAREQKECASGVLKVIKGHSSWNGACGQRGATPPRRPGARMYGVAQT
jgi:hypothetical protein